MERIVFLDRASIRATLRKPRFPHHWQDFPNTAPHEVTTHLRGASIAISNKVRLTRENLASISSLRFIAVCATGTNNVDLEYCRGQGIKVANIRNYAMYTVPEHVFMLVLALRRNLPAYRADVQRGLWQQAEQFCLMTHPIHDLNASTLGVVGHGALGQAVSRLAKAFGMRVLISEHKGAPSVRDGYTAFETVLKESDVISLHLPLTPATRHLIGATELRQMRASALLINTARGGLVDESALADALRQGRIAGAGFDVLTEEPPRAGNPLLDATLPNFILTPHNAWASVGAMQTMADQLIENIEAFQQGMPRNVVV